MVLRRASPVRTTVRRAVSASVAVALALLSIGATNSGAGPGRAPLAPWRWAESADSVAVFSIHVQAQGDPVAVGGVVVLKGGPQPLDVPASEAPLQTLSSGWVEAWGTRIDVDGLPRSYIAFIGDEIPDGAQLVPVGSSERPPATVGSPGFVNAALTAQLRSIFIEASEDPSALVATTGGMALLLSPRQPDPSVEGALARLADSEEGIARALGASGQALYGHPVSLGDAVVAIEREDIRPSLLAHDVWTWVGRALRACSGGAALPVLDGLLQGREQTKLARNAHNALADSALPEAVQLVAGRLGNMGDAVPQGTAWALSGLTLKHSWNYVSAAPDAEKEQVRQQWRGWWEQEGKPLFERTPPPPEPPSGPGDPMRLALADTGVGLEDVGGSTVSEAAVALALAEGILVALDTALPLEAALGPEVAGFPETPTVRDVIEMIARAAEGDPHVWEWGAAIGEPPPQWARGPTTPEVTAEEIAGVLERLPEPVADQLRRRRLIPAESLAADDWEIVRAIGRGRLPPDVDGTSLIDLPREDLDVMVDWEIRVDIEREDRDAVSVYFGRGNLSYQPIRAHCHSPVAPREWEPEDFQRSRWYSERLGNRGGPLGVTDHTLPYWQLRFALEAAEGVLVDHARRPLPAGGTIPLPAGPASVADLAQLVANAEGGVDCHVHPDLAAIEVLLVGPAAAATVANVKLAIAETVYGEWRCLDDTLYLGTAVFTPAQRERRAANGSRRWAPRLAQYCREYDPEIFRLWQAYATLGVGGDLGILPLELQQPLRLELRTTPSHQKEYRDGLWEPWNDGSVRGTARLVTELFIVHQDESRSASPAWGAVWVEPGPLEYPLDLFATAGR